MTMADWIRDKYEKHGRAWLHANFEQMCYELNTTCSSESYMRSIRKIVREKGIDNSSDVQTIEDSIDYHNIDMTAMDIKRVQVNTWGSPDNPNKQVKVELKPREPHIDTKAIIDDFRREIEGYRPFVYNHKRMELDSAITLEINIPDSHFGLLAWAKETGAQDYDINIARQLYLDCVGNLLDMAEPMGVSHIVLVTGSDFFNSDGLNNTTTKGTQQSEDSRFQKSFQVGWKTLRDAIDMCQEMADVEVVVIPGNHDFQKSFYLGEVLSAWYAESPHVQVDNEPTYYKYRKFGCTCVGYTHGDTVKPADLPLLMATDRPELWASTNYREWHIGHLHSDRVTEHRGCKVVHVPSIASASDWIAKNGYRSIREAQAFLYDDQYGRIASYSYRPTV